MKGTTRVLVTGLMCAAVAAVPAPAPAFPLLPALADPLPPGSWTLAWQDEFSGDRLDPTRWTTYSDSYADGCRGNRADHKLEYNLPANVSVRSGVLTITARRQAYTSPTGRRYPWTSGLITTGHSCGHDPSNGVTVRPGDFIQQHARLPAQPGMWPAFWTWADEVDVYEYHPDNRRILEMTNHAPGGGSRYQDVGLDLSAGWHHFGVYLGADRVDWYLDGRRIYSDPRGFAGSGVSLITNLSIADGTYHPVPSASTGRLQVDSVKVYRRP